MKNVFDKEKNIFLHNGLYIYKKITDKIIDSFEGELIQGNNLFDCIEKKRHYLVLDNEIRRIYLTDNEIDARSLVLASLEDFINLIKNMAGLFAIAGYDASYNDDNHFVGGVGIDNAFYKMIDASIIKEKNFYQVNIIYSREIAFAVAAFFDKTHMISSFVAPHLAGIVLLQGDKPGINEKGRELAEELKEYHIIIADKSLGAKDKFNSLEEECPFIIEINYKNLKNGLVRIKNVNEGNFYEVEFALLKDKMNELALSSLELCYKQSMEETYNYSKGQGEAFYCNEHIALNDDQIAIRPFSQRVIKKVCVICKAKATRRILTYDKRFINI